MGGCAPLEADKLEEVRDCAGLAVHADHLACSAPSRLQVPPPEAQSIGHVLHAALRRAILVEPLIRAGAGGNRGVLLERGTYDKLGAQSSYVRI